MRSCIRSVVCFFSVERFTGRGGRGQAGTCIEPYRRCILFSQLPVCCCTAVVRQYRTELQSSQIKPKFIQKTRGAGVRGRADAWIAGTIAVRQTVLRVYGQGPLYFTPSKPLTYATRCRFHRVTSTVSLKSPRATEPHTSDAPKPITAHLHHPASRQSRLGPDGNGLSVPPYAQATRKPRLAGNQHQAPPPRGRVLPLGATYTHYHDLSQPSKSG